MGKFGRSRASITVMFQTLLGWIWIVLSTSSTSLLLARAFLGIPLGMGLVIAPVMIAEYSNPRNRAAFVATMLVITSLMVLAVHTIGAYITWQITALMVAVTAFIGLLISIYTPESPSWLADQERYDECVKVFRWLRGAQEEDELQELIRARKLIKSDVQLKQLQKKSMPVTITKMKTVVMRREFYLPIFIMLHLSTLARWSGLCMLLSYPMDAFSNLYGPDFNFGLQISLLDSTRLLSNIIGIYVTKKMQRRRLLLITALLNTCVLFAMAIYSYAKVNNMLPFDHPLIGITLCHMLIISIKCGASSLPLVILGELFPLEIRSFAAGLSSAVFSFNMFVTVKIFPYLLKTIGFYATMFLHSAIVGYCLIVALAIMPETKDRTLQDIEDELKGNKDVGDELESAINLNSLSNRD